MNIRTLFCKEIYRELQEFKASMLHQEKENIVKECYKIDQIISIYEILFEQTESMSDSKMWALLERSNGILESLYDSWLNKKDNHYNELQQHVLEEAA